MNWDDIMERVGNVSRPYSILFLSHCLGISTFFPWVNGAAQALIGSTITVLVGARAYENIVQTKTAAVSADVTTNANKQVAAAQSQNVAADKQILAAVKQENAATKE